MKHPIKKIFALIALITLSMILSGYQNMPTKGAEPAKAPKIGHHEGTALSAIKADSYIYVEIDTGEGSVWVAAPITEVNKGDKVSTSKGIEMRNFFSKTLKKTFPVIFFVGKIDIEGAHHSQGSKEIKAAKTVEAPPKGSITKADDGLTLSEIFSMEKSEKGKVVTVRAMIVKASGNIMGSYWYHVQDGTGEGKNLDLVVTSKQQTEAGNIAIIKGMLNFDRDFGMGYLYERIIEEAEIKVEQKQ